METYDAIGAYQETEGGVAIDATADVLIGQTIVSVNGPVELMEAIANSPEAQTCYARHWVQYAYGRSLTSEDSCTVEDIATKLTQDTYTIVNLIADLTQSQSFRYRALETEAAL
jgi:hypothetical protein